VDAFNASVRRVVPGLQLFSLQFPRVSCFPDTFNGSGRRTVDAFNASVWRGEPVAVCHWSANSDLKFFLLSAQSYKRITEAGLDCEDCLRNLHIAGMQGLDQSAAESTAIIHATGYSCCGRVRLGEGKNPLQFPKSSLRGDRSVP
jgi:hypothetical protein